MLVGLDEPSAGKAHFTHLSLASPVSYFRRPLATKRMQDAIVSQAQELTLVFTSLVWPAQGLYTTYYTYFAPAPQGSPMPLCPSSEIAAATCAGSRA